MTTGPSARSAAPKPALPGFSRTASPTLSRPPAASASAIVVAARGQVGPMPGVSGERQRIGDQQVAIGGVVGVGHMRRRGRVPFPGRQPVVPQQHLRAGKRPDAVEIAAVVGKIGQEQSVALTFAVADIAIGIVDDSAGRVEELVLVGGPFRRW